MLMLILLQMSGGTHKHRYKNAGLDSTELRRRREEEGVQLRKQKREQQLFKKRNANLLQPIDDDLSVSSSPAIKCMRYFILPTKFYILRNNGFYFLEELTTSLARLHHTILMFARGI